MKIDDVTSVLQQPKTCLLSERKERSPNSIALIANTPSSGVILDFEGDHIEQEIEAVVGRSLSDYGLDDAPEGLSIWEGHIAVWGGSYEYPSEVDSALKGSFRDLTVQEWGLLMFSGCPWETKEADLRQDEPPCTFTITYFKPGGKYYTTDEVTWPKDDPDHSGWNPLSTIHRIKTMHAVCTEAPHGFPQFSPAQEKPELG